MTEEQKKIIEEMDRLSVVCTGRTTKLIDKYIQSLYKNQGKWVLITDHDPSGDKILIDKICSRMELEHPDDIIERDVENFRIKLVSSARDAIWTKIKELQTQYYKLGIDY